MSDFFDQLRLSDLQDFLTSGQPSLIVQLLVINTIMFIFFILRRIRGAQHMQRHVTYTTQWILVGTNLAVLWQQQWMPFLDNSSHTIVENFYQVIRPY